MLATTNEPTAADDRARVTRWRVGLGLGCHNGEVVVFSCWRATVVDAEADGRHQEEIAWIPG